MLKRPGSCRRVCVPALIAFILLAVVTPALAQPVDDLPPGVGHTRTCATLKAIPPTRIFYVATNGNDGNAGSQAAPWRTLQKACDTVQAGDAVYVKAGTYAGCVIFNDGTESNPIVIQAAPSGSGYEAVTIDRKSSATSQSHGVLNAEGADWVVFRGFRVTGSDARTGIRIVAGTGQSICDNTIEDSDVWGVLGGFTVKALVENNKIYRPSQQHCIYFGERDQQYVVRSNYLDSPNFIGIHNNGSGATNSFALIEKNILYKTGIGGGAQINGDGLEESVIRNNLFYDGGRNGIVLFTQDAGGGSKNNRIVGNTFYFSPGTSPAFFAVALNDGATGNKIYNNILWRTPTGVRGSLAVDATAMQGLESNFNIFAGSGTGAVNLDDSANESNPITLAQWQSMGFDTNSIVVSNANDLFQDLAGRNFQLKATSPARDAGTALSFVKYDILGVTRPMGSAFDIGAYELQVAGPDVPPSAPTNLRRSFLRLSHPHTLLGTTFLPAP